MYHAPKDDSHHNEAVSSRESILCPNAQILTQRQANTMHNEVFDQSLSEPLNHALAPDAPLSRHGVISHDHQLG
ncbi:unnamed protein product [marine sediment metagenome]|uniref:Uncharacterized protein n=1 Tax=marine sediment metagenome TaxID=412755 RepID=X1KVZ0_9ZZZZ